MSGVRKPHPDLVRVIEGASDAFPGDWTNEDLGEFAYIARAVAEWLTSPETARRAQDADVRTFSAALAAAVWEPSVEEGK